MTLGADIHVPNKMNCNDFGEPLTFELRPPSGKSNDTPAAIVLVLSAS